MNATNTFNTDAALWVAFFRSHPSIDLTYCDGAVYVAGECRALFASNKAAMDTMQEARRLAGVL